MQLMLAKISQQDDSPRGEGLAGMASTLSPSASSSLRAAMRPAASGNDEDDLRSWAATAAIGDEKTCSVGKDRRKHLHRVCDELNSTQSMWQLTHASHGSSRRCLVIKKSASSDARTENSHVGGRLLIFC